MAPEAAAELVDAINERDPARLEPLLNDRSEVVTGRASHVGIEAVTAWSRKEYDHLVRRYAIDEFRGEGERVLALGAVHYVWRDGGEVADSSPIALDIELEGGTLRRLIILDDVTAAVAAFEPSP